MIIETEKLKSACKKILDAVDTSNGGIITSELLELKATQDTLVLNVTNTEYFVRVKIPCLHGNNLHAVVNAKVFLNLISKITTAEIQLELKDFVLAVKGNGQYKLPLVYNADGKLETLSEIKIDEVTNRFKIPTKTLQSILKFNIKEVQKRGITNEIQKMFYIDEKGALTFTQGACVNTFELAEPVKFLLTEKIVKLFKLFSSENVDFTLGFSSSQNGIITRKACFKTDDVEISTLISSDEKIINSFPVFNIRNLANKAYNYNIVVDRLLILESINRLAVFDKDANINQYLNFEFSSHKITISDANNDNKETIVFNTDVNIDDFEYKAMLQVNSLRIALESFTSQYVSVCFGDSRSMTFIADSIKYIVPECARQ